MPQLHPWSQKPQEHQDDTALVAALTRRLEAAEVDVTRLRAALAPLAAFETRIALHPVPASAINRARRALELSAHRRPPVIVATPSVRRPLVRANSQGQNRR